MNTLAARFDHSFAPGRSPEAARALAEILTRPCFDACLRVSAMRGDRQTGYAPKSAGAVGDRLADPRNDSVILDNGRGGRIVARVRIDTGHAARGAHTTRPAPLVSYALMPLGERVRPPLVESFCDLAVALGAVAGAITAEESFDKAQNFALSIKSDRSGDLATGMTTEARLKERAAHYFFSEEIGERIAAPEWGLFLSAGHLKRVPPRQLERSSAFSVVRLLSDDLAYVGITDDPLDALSPDFTEPLARARAALRPALMDAASLPDYAWK